MKPRLQHVICQEKKLSLSGMKAVVSLANGDMRKALNILQSTSMAHEEVNEDTVYTCTGELRKRQLFPSSCVAIALHLQMD